MLMAPARALMKILNTITFSILTLTLGMIGCSGESSDDSDDDCNVPACIMRMYELVVSCAPMGTCVEQTSEAGINQCYSDGSRLSAVVGEGGSATVRLTHPDGSTCLTEDIVSNGEGINIVIRDASGAALGTATANADGSTTISCDGRTYPESEFDCDGDADDDDGEPATCTMGTCP